jgi:hypothetical protein
LDTLAAYKGDKVAIQGGIGPEQLANLIQGLQSFPPRPGAGYLCHAEASGMLISADAAPTQFALEPERHFDAVEMG